MRVRRPIVPLFVIPFKIFPSRFIVPSNTFEVALPVVIRFTSSWEQYFFVRVNEWVRIEESRGREEREKKDTWGASKGVSETSISERTFEMPLVRIALYTNKSTPQPDRSKLDTESAKKKEMRKKRKKEKKKEIKPVKEEIFVRIACWSSVAVEKDAAVQSTNLYALNLFGFAGLLNNNK